MMTRGRSTVLEMSLPQELGVVLRRLYFGVVVNRYLLFIKTVILEHHLVLAL